MDSKVLFIAFLFLSVSAEGQWFDQNINITESLGGIQFVNSNKGWVFGSEAVPLHVYGTTNGGITWNTQRNFDGPLLSRFFLDENNGWFAYLWSVGSKVARTTDGGNTWPDVFTGTYISLNSMVFLNTQIGIGAGGWGAPQSGAIFKTSDGGASWNVVFQTWSIFRTCFFLNSTTGWCGGWAPQDSSSIFMTTDGGDTWTPYPAAGLSGIREMQFFDPLTAWINNDGILYSTTNGGITWTQRASPVSGFYFVTPLTGWYVSGGNIFHTQNGGITWSIQYSSPGSTLYDIYFVNNNAGWASGASGKMVYTLNGGTPVELVTFTAEYVNKEVILKWTTSTESNNMGFYVEKKTGNTAWQSISFVEGSGTTSAEHSYSFTDKDVLEGICIYRLKQTDFDGSYEYSPEVSINISTPDVFSLEQNYPNPFNPSTTIGYNIPEEGTAVITIYDVLGNEILSMTKVHQQGGRYELQWDAAELPAGTYFYRLQAGEFSAVKKMMLLK